MRNTSRRVLFWLLLAGLCTAGAGNAAQAAAPQQQPPPAGQAQGQPTFTSNEIVELVAPIALYPDALLSQILVCSTSPYQVRGLNEWLKKNPHLKGSAVLEAAQKEGFDQNFVSISVFPDVVKMMAEKMEWTTKLGQAFTSDRKAVFEWIQRLRAQAETAGNLKDTPQQQVETQTTKDGTQIIVIQPTNPQVIYVPQYNPQVVYTQPAPTTTTVVVHEEHDHSDAVAAGVIGFTAGIIIGAASDPYWGPYYGPYGWYGGGYYMYDDAWNDFYEHREDMWNDWQENRTERTETRQENRTERQENRQENRGDRQTGREENRTERQGTRDERQTGRQEDRSARQEGRDPMQERRDQAQQRQNDKSAQGDRGLGGDRAGQRPSNMDSRGYGDRGQAASRQRSGSSSGAFSGYERGSASRSSSSRGRSSMGSSRGGGGGRSRGGGGRRR